MNQSEFVRTRNTLVLIAKMTATLDLDGFLAAIEYADTLALITNPTLYREASGKLSQVRDLARSLEPFAAEVRRQTGGA